MKTNEELRAWLVGVVRGIVMNPDGVSATCAEDDTGVHVVLKVSPRDCGRVIGRQGAIAQALRVLLRSAGYTFDVKASLSVDVPGRAFTPPPIDDEELGLVQRPRVPVLTH